MATDVKVPPMGESITSGILASWHVKDGDVVSEGDVLYELETDKITSEGQAQASGKIKIKAGEGDEVEIDQVIAEIDESVKPAVKTETPAETTSAPEVATQAPAPTGKQSDAISPAVRRLATETGINPSTVNGSGKDGRVTKGDMLGVAKSGGTTPAVMAPGERTTRIKMTPLRRKIAERLVASTQEAAMLTTFNEVDMSTVMKMRKDHQKAFVDKYGLKIGFMSFFVKAAVYALKEVPQINAQLDGDHIIQNNFYDIGVAVGGSKGLVVPVVRDCDQLGFHEIEQHIGGYAKKARDGKLSIDEMMGGVFTISNGGIYGSMLSTPIINPPQSAILGMHNITERAVVIDGKIEIRPMMYLALSYDHRIVDGKEAVTFLLRIKQAIEDPSLGAAKKIIGL